MSIRSFAFTDKASGWTLKETSFGQLNLLVGPSGVGKTRIIESLRAVQRAAIDDLMDVAASEWRLVVDSPQHRYEWRAATVGPATTSDTGLAEELGQTLELEREHLTIDGVVLVRRDAKQFRYLDKDLPKFTLEDSTIRLLDGEDDIWPLHESLQRIVFAPGPVELADLPIVTTENLERLRSRYSDPASLRHATDVHVLLRTYLLQEFFPVEFAELKARYCDMFGLRDVRIGPAKDFAAFRRFVAASVYVVDELVVGIKEEGVTDFIVGSQISSGMLRAFALLATLALAPEGAVVIIDEFENSFGINCLPALTEHILERTDLQFILTSHHPYIINQIPTEHWKLVRRKGSTVEVLGYEDIPELKTASSLDRFTLLVNLREYEEGIQ